MLDIHPSTDIKNEPLLLSVTTKWEKKTLHGLCHVRSLWLDLLRGSIWLELSSSKIHRFLPSHCLSFIFGRLFEHVKIADSSAPPISPSMGNPDGSTEAVIFSYTPLIIILAVFLVFLLLIALGLCVRTVQMTLALCARAGQCCRGCCSRRWRVVVWPVVETT